MFRDKIPSAEDMHSTYLKNSEIKKLNDIQKREEVKNYLLDVVATTLKESEKNWRCHINKYNVREGMYHVSNSPGYRENPVYLAWADVAEILEKKGYNVDLRWSGDISMTIDW